MKSFSFPKCERLLNRKDFVNLNLSGKRFKTGHFTVIFKKNGLIITRLGITVSKRIGNAARRNRVKRLVRESYRLNKGSFPKGYDVVVIANRGAHNLGFSDIGEELGNIRFAEKTDI